MDITKFLTDMDEDTRTIARAELDLAINHVKAVINIINDKDNAIGIPRVIVSLTLLKALFVDPDDTKSQMEAVMGILELMNKKDKDQS